MILTEADLAPFRDANGLVHLEPLPGLLGSAAALLSSGRVVLPNGLLTPTHKAFVADWNAFDADRPRETLEAIPVLAFRRKVPVLNPTLEWRGLIHQCSGSYCQQMRMIATRLRPRPAVAEHLNAIVREHYGRDAGFVHHDNLRASQIVSYVEMLARLGLNCEISWKNLTEGVYPIDATQLHLDLLTEEAPPLAEIADWSHEDPEHGAVILLLAWNSD
ncbi:hypothetical protein [Ensifer sp. MJa1]|uniref:hypothetical protein n=1 Tax=Ensifer sp. MJa1 TaxID=2919888 RepID=UPI0030085A40